MLLSLMLLPQKKESLPVIWKSELVLSGSLIPFLKTGALELATDHLLDRRIPLASFLVPSTVNHILPY